MAERRPALGKGLSALIPDVPEPVPPRASLDVDIDLLEPNDYQPRTHVPDEQLDQLARSITANGIIQPIVARLLDGGRYQIIAGERRWRAAQRAGLLRVPIVVKDVAPGEPKRRLEMALIENVQRADLNPIEEGQAYQRLVTEFGMTHEEVAAQVGKDRSSVANTLRLLRLPEEVRAEVASGRLTMGHARNSAASRATSSRAAFQCETLKRSCVRARRRPRAAGQRRTSRRRTFTPEPRRRSCAARLAPTSKSSAAANAGSSKSPSRTRTSCSGYTNISPRDGDRGPDDADSSGLRITRSGDPQLAAIGEICG
jgi:ParB family chromosome partitioning protein